MMWSVLRHRLRRTKRWSVLFVTGVLELIWVDMELIEAFGFLARQVEALIVWLIMMNTSVAL